MGIILPPPPDNAMAILTDAVTDLQAGDPTRAAGGGSARAAPHPFPLFRLTLAAIRCGTDPLRSVKQVGWRYLVERDGTPAIADLHQRSLNGALNFGQIASGPLVDRFIARAQQAETLVSNDSRKEDDYQARILEVPALHISALWLEGGHPLFLLVSPEDRADPLDASEFRAFLLAAAASLREATQRRPG